MKKRIDFVREELCKALLEREDHPRGSPKWRAYDAKAGRFARKEAESYFKSLKAVLRHRREREEGKSRG